MRRKINLKKDGKLTQKGVCLVEALLLCILIIPIALLVFTVAVNKTKAVSTAGKIIQAERIGEQILENYKKTHYILPVGKTENITQGEFSCIVKVIGEIYPGCKMLINEVTWGENKKVFVYMHTQPDPGD